jgi:hypothetical protein
LLQECEGEGGATIKQVIERDMRRLLLESSRMSAPSKTGTGLFSFKSAAQPVLEIDGAPAREFFTVCINQSINQSTVHRMRESIRQQLIAMVVDTDLEQCFGIHRRSAVQCILVLIVAFVVECSVSWYARQSPGTSVDITTSMSYCPDSSACLLLLLLLLLLHPESESDSNLHESCVLEEWMQEIIITYCTRVISQSALPFAKDKDSISSIRGNISNPDVSDTALYEVVRIFDLICLLDPNPVCTRCATSNSCHYHHCNQRHRLTLKRTFTDATTV